MFFKLNTTARILTSFLLALTIPHQLATAAELPVNLGSAASFGVLAGSTVTSTGDTIVNGDLGVSPGYSVSGFPPGTVNGNIYVADLTAAQAQLDLTIAYNDAAGRSTAPVTVAGNIGGQTLPPGLYKSTSGLAISSGDLTLDGQGDPNAVFIFQIASTLVTTSGRQVILIGGAQAANVFWQVGSSATIGTTSEMKGTILADQSITIATGATLEGRALARIGAVTLDGNGITVTVPTVPTGVAPEIVVEQPLGANIADGGSKDFGSVAVGTSTSLTFTIKNIGTADLTISGISIDGANAASFTVPNLIATVSPSGSTTFTVQFAPGSTGLNTAALHIANNDTSNNPFNIALTGTGTGTGGGIDVTVVSAITLNWQTGLFEQIVRLHNNSLNRFDGRLLIQALPAQVYNASSSTSNGTPFVQFSLPPNSSTNLLIEYYRANRVIDFDPTFEVQEIPLVPVTATGPVIAMDLQRPPFQSGRFFIEFSATQGRRYAVQYSSDMTSWKTADPIITAPANRVQWYDDGPPKTESIPTTIGSRFYRIMELP
jgi:Ice-binding-like/Abnormal spindle-like microcephaly-assoc'd, ASPM-SPD-2-Hydin